MPSINPSSSAQRIFFSISRAPFLYGNISEYKFYSIHRVPRKRKPLCSSPQYNTDNVLDPKHNKINLKQYKYYTFHIVQCVSQHFKLSKIKRVTECFVIEICTSTRLQEKRSKLLDSSIFNKSSYSSHIIVFLHNENKHLKKVPEVTSQLFPPTIIKSKV